MHVSRYCTSSVCKNGRVYDSFTESVTDDVSMEISWYQLEAVDQRMVKVKKEGTDNEVLNKVKLQLQVFLGHCFIKRMQSRSFEDTRLNTEETVTLRNSKHWGNSHIEEESIEIQLDFLENYAAQYQDEIQSAHWNAYTQVMCSQSLSGLQAVVRELYVISDYLSHDKLAVYHYLAVAL